MFGRLLCYLGFHQWRATPVYGTKITIPGRRAERKKVSWYWSCIRKGCGAIDASAVDNG